MGEMTTNDRMLAEAWRDLAGWKPGMVVVDLRYDTRDFVIDVDPGDDLPVEFATLGWNSSELADCLPALDSPANWGHWLAWAEERVPGMRLGRDDMAESWEALRGGTVYKGTVPRALLGLLMKVYGEMPTFPPSVLAWWKAEQEGEAE